MENIGVMVKISVIVPVYNCSKYLQGTIESILSQSYINFELLLIDDGSKDASLDICYEYARLDSRIKVFHKDNGGVSSARNLGLRNAVGEYIVFVDSDDFIAIDMLECLYNDIVSNKCDVAICGYKHMNIEEYNEFQGIRENNSVATIILKPLEAYYESQDVSCICNKLYDTNIIKGLFFNEDINYGEDLLYTALVMSKAKRISIRKDIKYFYIRRENSLSWQDGNIKFWQGYIDSKKIIYDSLVESGVEQSIVKNAWQEYCKAIIAIYRYVVHKRLHIDYIEIDNKYRNIMKKYINNGNLSFAKKIEYFSFIYSFSLACLFHKAK